MKKMCSKLGKMLLPAMLLVMLLGLNAMAAGDKTVDMTPGSDNTYTYVGVEEDSSTTVYHRITVPSSGALAVTGNSVIGNGTYGLEVALCNSAMQVIDQEARGAWVNGDSSVEVYGVKKGTYYLKVSGEQKYALIAQYTKVANNGGTSKKKAKTIKLGKTVKGVMPSGEKSSSADWYKIKVTKKKQLELSLATEGNGYFEFWLYGPSYKKGVKFASLKNDGGVYRSMTLARKKAKVKTGTYYVKVVRSSVNKKASGVYSIKGKLR